MTRYCVWILFSAYLCRKHKLYSRNYYSWIGWFVRSSLLPYNFNCQIWPLEDAHYEPWWYYTDYCKHTWPTVANDIQGENLTHYCLCMFKITKFEFQCAIRINYHSYTQLHLACREILNELQVQFIIIASSKTRQLTGIQLYTDIFRAPPRAERVLMQRKTSVTIIL